MSLRRGRLSNAECCGRAAPIEVSNPTDFLIDTRGPSRKGQRELSAPERVGIGIIGCGNISGIYLANAKRFPILDLRACADIDLERAAARASEYGVPCHCSVEELLADPSIDIVINLTVPAAHSAVALAAVSAGKSVYNEKPLTIGFEDGKRLLELATANGVRVGCAPDTFLGAGLQTCRQIIDDGGIGQPVAGTAFFLGHGPEAWHPDPNFFYQEGAGPLFDMGPYYLTALVSLLGPVRRVTGSARASFPERTVGSGTTIVVASGLTIQEAVDEHPPAGPLTYSVVAVDVAGNVSAAATCSTVMGTEP